MLEHRHRIGWVGLCAAVILFGVASLVAKDKKPLVPKPEPLALIVMDPLAKDLACACLSGYGQRNYGKLAAHLARQLDQGVTFSFSEDLADSVARLGPDQPVIVIGKYSVITHAAGPAGFKGRALCRLTGMDGSTTLTGFFVTRQDDPAKSLQDLAGRRIIFGPVSAEEKHGAALAALRAVGITPPAKLETREVCSETALEVVDSKENPPPVGVISSSSLPLLEGCGSIKQGDLVVIGQTEPVPFVTVFVSENIAAAKRQRIFESLLAVGKSSRLRQALETKAGFVPLANGSPGGGRSSVAAEWPDWRGFARDGRVAHLPAKLPETPRLIWKQPALNGGLAGLAVAEGRVLVAERDPADEKDVFRCLRAGDGELLWLVEYPAPGKLDYGQFPRATPVVRDGRVFLLGAFGDLRCVNLADGKVIWKRQLVGDFGGKLPTWGTCATPLIVDDLLIVNPGAPKASLAALDLRTGRTRWTSPGQPAAYGSFIAATLGGRRQVVGYDQKSLGGWDPKTGARLWSLVPPTEGDFNVPTPMAVDGKLFVATENNGARIYGFNPEGRIVPAPLGEYGGLSPDTATPVSTNGRVFGSHLGLHCLDVSNNLKCQWRAEDKAFDEHTSLFASEDRVLVVALDGELLLLNAKASQPEVVSRLRLFDEDAEIYSHPALVNSRLYVRGPSSICCVELSGD